MKCPYCNKEDFIPNVVFLNVEYYGSKTLRYRCFHCNNVVESRVIRQVIVTTANKTNKESDF